MKLNNILESIGSTPHLRINHLFGAGHEVWIKLESFNPGGSIKDRIALAMIETAEKEGFLRPESVIVEPTSGNTGIGLALVAAVKGYKLKLVMPESMSVERRGMMAAYGAEFVLTPRENGMKGAMAKVAEMLAENPHWWSPSQFVNPANPEVHVRYTAAEIIKDFPDGFDYLITGVGTGGHITGVARELKKKFPEIKVLAVEPELSPVISGGKPGPHPIQGIGAGFIPANLDTSLLDGTIAVGKDEAFEFARRAAQREGLFGGISTGATLAAIAKQLSTLTNKTKIIGFNYDSGDRYLSIEGLY